MTTMGRHRFWHCDRSAFVGHVQHGADLQARNSNWGPASQNGPLDRHFQATRASHAQAGQHGQRHREGTTGCKVSKPI